MKWFLLACGAAWALATTSVAATIEIPLKYTESRGRGTGAKIASIKVADFDMTAPGAKPAPVSIELGTSNTEAGVTLNPSDPSVPGKEAGKSYRFNRQYPGQGFYVDPTYSQNGAKSEFYILIEYLDDIAPGSKLNLGYMSIGGEIASLYNQVDGAFFDGTNKWRTYQFHIKDAKWDRRKTVSGNQVASDFWIGVTQLGSQLEPSGYRSLQVSSQPPPGSWKLPKSEFCPLAYASFDFNGQKKLLVFDKATSESKLYNRLWFDANDDGDLTDDPPVTVELPEKGEMSVVSFPAITTTVTVEGKPLPYRFNAEAYGETMFLSFEGGGTVTSMSPQNMRVYLSPACYYLGETVVDGRKHTVVLGDKDCDGRFNGVRFQRDENDQGDSFAIGTTVTQMRQGGLPTHLVLGGKVYDLQVREHEAKLVLSENTEPSGILKLSAATSMLQMFVPDRKRLFFAPDCPTELKVPAGEYRIDSYLMEKRDPEGDLWQVVCAGGRSPAKIAAEGGAAELKFGEPFQTTVDARNAVSSPVPSQPRSGGLMDWFFGSSGSSTSSALPLVMEMSFSMRDCGGGYVTNLNRAEGTKSKIELSKRVPTRPKEPQYKITKPDGESMATGAFEYG